MSFWNKYPYTDFHELNADYLLNRISEIEKQIATIKEEIEGEIFIWVQAQLKPYEDQLKALVKQVNDLSGEVDATLKAYDQKITNIQNSVNTQLANMRKQIEDTAAALSDLMDIKIDSNNTWLINEISRNIGSLFTVVDPFTGDTVPIQAMIDTLSEYHITDGITYDTMNTRALTYAQFNALNISYSDLLLHGHTLYT